jgi:hypothetical protein
MQQEKLIFFYKKNGEKLHNSFTADVHRLLKDIETFPVA